MSRNIKETVSTIDVAHARVHAGEQFTTSHYNASLANAASLNLLVKTGTGIIHILFSGTASALCIGLLFENSTVSANGTTLSSMNHNRNSSSTTTATIYHTPTITSDGTQLDGTSLIPGSSGGGLGQGSVGSSAPDFTREIILKPNTNYIFRLTNVSGSTAHTVSRVEFYEPGL